MEKSLKKEELERLGLSADEDGEIYLNGQRIPITFVRTPRGISYPRVWVYDPMIWRRTGSHGHRNILAGRLVYAYFNGECPKGYYVKPKDGNHLNLRPSNLYLQPKRGTRE